MELLYWGIGAHLGLPWAQNKHGHVLGDVTDQAKAPDDPTSRGNELGGIALPFPLRRSDLVGLMCLENGVTRRTLGRRQLCAHPQPARAERPDLAAALYEWLPYDYRGEQPEGGRPSTPSRCSPSGMTGCSSAASRRYIWASQRHPDAPRLTEDQPTPSVWS